MRLFVLVFLALQFISAQSDILQQKFNEKLKDISDRSDAVIGISVKDLNSGEKFSVNEKEIFPTASSIKIFILTEVYRQAAEGKFKLTDIRPLPVSARVAGSGILSMLGEKSVSMSIRDYCVLMMNLSDNTATNLLIDLVGLKNVNEFAVKNGCNATKLQRIMMDVQAAKEGRENISSPQDFLTILEKLYRGEIVSKQASDDMLTIMKLEKDGWIKSGIPSGTVIANKAGDIEGIKCDAAIVYMDNAPYIICVMTKMLLNDSDGGPFITDISKSVYQYLERKAHSNQYGRRIPK
ncbi:MAG: serine hydrolase [Bacteroidota bacterium]